MTPEKWQKVKSLFATVQEMPAGARQEFLFEASDGDHEISAEVIKLLDSYSEDDEFLENSAVAEVASMIEEDGLLGETSDPDEPRFATGLLVDRRYEIVRMLGKGGMGEVYLANDKNLDRKVALKVLPAELTESKTRLHRFEQEARAVSALNHPHILTIFEFGESGDGDHYIASEYVEGKTLNALSASMELRLQKVLDIAEQVTSALSAAHEAGITHRDIKPDNIMVRHDGYIKVLDFGLAKLTEAERGRSTDSEAATKAMVNTAPGSVMGTAAYMSPEQARGLNVDARTDLWSLGVVMYEMLTGQQPFKGDTATDTIVAVLKKEPAPISTYVANLPAEIEWVISKTLSKELDGRYQTAKELHADIAKIKKHVEFLDERERTSQPVRHPEGLESPTVLLERSPTDLKHAETTREITEGIKPPQDSGRESSFEYAVKGAFRHKALSAVFAVLLVAVISVAAYYILMSARTAGTIDSIAVLPFENGSGDSKLVYLSDGISENLIDRLSQISQLKVIARTSSWKFRGAGLDIQDVARQLGVRAIVTGKVVQVGDQLKIRVDVMDVSENKQIWGQTFNRKAEDVMSIQNEIAQAVSEKLSLKLTNSEEKRLTNGGTENAEAYRVFLNGLVQKRGPDGSQSNALEYFLKAVELDPNFAQAHAEISLVYSVRAISSGNPRELMPKAKAAALKALEIDDDLAIAHVALATVQEFEFDWKGAARSYQRAIELNPNLDTARDRYSFFLSVMGSHEEALQENEQALLRDPVNKRLHLQFKAMNLIQARRYDDAIAAFDEAQKIEATGNSLSFYFGYAYAAKGMYKEAGAAFKESVDLEGGDDKYSQPLVYLAAVYAKIPEKRAEAVAIKIRLEQTDEYVSPALMAVLYAALDENENAIKALEEAFDKQDVLLRYIKVAYEYDSLRDDPRFKMLLRRTGLGD